MRALVKMGNLIFFSGVWVAWVWGDFSCLGNGFLQLLGGFSAPLILLSAHELFCLSAIYIIRRAAGGTGGGSIYGSVSFSLTRLGPEHAAPFQRGGVIQIVSGVWLALLHSSFGGFSYRVLALGASSLSRPHDEFLLGCEFLLFFTRLCRCEAKIGQCRVRDGRGRRN